jgi:hypothetical protein
MSLAHLKSLYKKYEKFFIPGLLLAGVVLDFVTFRALDIKTTLILLGIYALAAAICIVYTNIYDGKNPVPTSPALQYARLGAPLIVQFTFGALLSMSMIFYWYSGSLSVSWPILITAIVLMASNEVFRHFLMRPIPQMSVFAFILFSLFIVAFPFALNSIEPLTFFGGGFAGLIIVFVLCAILIRFAPQVRAQWAKLLLAVLTVFGVMNALYFWNVIPPIPLSIRDAGAYHKVERVNGEYILTGEPESFFQSLIRGQVIHRAANERVYVYTAIFAPGTLSTQIFHRWERYDEAKKSWITTDRVSYAITGGRDGGYRGYSYKTRLSEGKWRVTIETSRGQVLGRVPFTFELTQ